jgi:hypothetical protein
MSTRLVVTPSANSLPIKEERYPKSRKLPEPVQPAVEATTTILRAPVFRFSPSRLCAITDLSSNELALSRILHLIF